MKPIFHGTFHIERVYKAKPGRVFAAWSDVDTKAKWFVGPGEWQVVRRELDLRVGGIEIAEGKFPSGPTTLFTARFHEVVPNERIVYAYDMHVDGRFFSTSLASVELFAHERGARMRFTEQGAFYDDAYSVEQRKSGTLPHFERLGKLLDG